MLSFRISILDRRYNTVRRVLNGFLVLFVLSVIDVGAQTAAPDFQSLFNTGISLYDEKRFDEAEKKFRELLSEDPNNAPALNYLGYMLADRNVKLGDAHVMIQKALDLDPQNGAYLDSLGWVYYRQNKFKLAERYLRRSLEKYKHDPTVLSHLGDVYLKLDQAKLAEKHWRRSIEEWERSAPSDRDDDAINELRKKLSNITPHSSSGATNGKKLP